ncbi:MAG: O-antigen polymerase [Legionella sp.]|jgi:oligosaccharide repeat unit polymerase
MLVVLICQLLLGILISWLPQAGKLNPFKIYFFIWLSILVGIYSLDNQWHQLTINFEILLFAFFSIYLLASIIHLNLNWECNENHQDLSYFSSRVNIAQFTVYLALIPFYLKAVEIAQASPFSIEGYVTLRSQFTQNNVSYGALSYFVTLSFILSSVNISRYFDRAIGKLQLILSFSASIFYAYLSTGRTYFLMLACMSFFPLMMRNKIKFRGAVFVIICVMLSFITVALMTRKGVSLYSSQSEIMQSVLFNIKLYLLSPVLAMSKLFEEYQGVQEIAAHSFRFVYNLFYKMGLSAEATSLIREVTYVPFPTNVYTVFDPYFRDFNVIGVLIFGLVSAILHISLYVKAKNTSGPYIFIYSASLFALIMQFFQDMYISLLSSWIQIVFWYMLFIRKNKAQRLVYEYQS